MNGRDAAAFLRGRHCVGVCARALSPVSGEALKPTLHSRMHLDDKIDSSSSDNADPARPVKTSRALLPSVAPPDSSDPRLAYSGRLQPNMRARPADLRLGHAGCDSTRPIPTKPAARKAMGYSRQRDRGDGPGSRYYSVPCSDVDAYALAAARLRACSANSSAVTSTSFPSFPGRSRISPGAR